MSCPVIGVKNVTQLVETSSSVVYGEAVNAMIVEVISHIVRMSHALP